MENVTDDNRNDELSLNESGAVASAGVADITTWLSALQRCEDNAGHEKAQRAHLPLFFSRIHDDQHNIKEHMMRLAVQRGLLDSRESDPISTALGYVTEARLLLSKSQDNKEQAFERLHMASQLENADAMDLLAKLYIGNSDLALAEEWVLRAATAGNSQSCFTRKLH
jgi:hypothetical protein